jgi:phage tail protein X
LSFITAAADTMRATLATRAVTFDTTDVLVLRAFGYCEVSITSAITGAHTCAAWSLDSTPAVAVAGVGVVDEVA